MQLTSPEMQIQSVQTAAAHLSVQHELGMQEEMIVAIWAVPAACTGSDRPKPKGHVSLAQRVPVSHHSGCTSPGKWLEARGARKCRKCKRIGQN